MTHGAGVWKAVLAGALLRLALLTGLWLTGNADLALTPDSISYLAPAAALARGAGFDDAWDAPELVRTPGYPLLLVPGMWFGAPVAWALLGQVLLSMVLIRQTAHLAIDAGLDARTGTVAAWVCALDPWLVVMTTRVMSEIACVLAMTIGLRFATQALGAPPDGTLSSDEARRRAAYWAGAWLAAATYVRPICGAAWLVVVVALALSRRSPGARTALPRMTSAVGCAVVFIALTIPWQVRNGLVSGYWGFSTMAPRVLYLTLGGTAQAAVQARPFQEVRVERLDSARADMPPASLISRGVRDVLTAPLAVLRAHAAGMLRVAADPGGIEWLRSLGAYPAAGGLLRTVQDGGLASALARLARERPLAIAALALSAITLLVWPLALRGLRVVPPAIGITWAGVVVSLTLLSGGVHANGRFRVPYVPVLAALAAAGLPRVTSGYTRRHR